VEFIYKKYINLYILAIYSYLKLHILAIILWSFVEFWRVYLGEFIDKYLSIVFNKANKISLIAVYLQVI
jgi:hypothetical protein